MTTTTCAQCGNAFAQKDLFATPRGLVCAFGLASGVIDLGLVQVVRGLGLV